MLRQLSPVADISWQRLGAAMGPSPNPLAAFNGKPHNIINQRSQSLY
jgi:hypothetical protein